MESMMTYSSSSSLDSMEDLSLSYDFSDFYNPMSIQQAWNHQFSSFVAKDVDGIMMNYSEESILFVFDQTTDVFVVYHGLEEIRDLMVDFFGTLTDTSDLAGPVLEISEEDKMVFLVWRAPASGYLDGTDTVIFDDEYKIYRLNLVYSFV